MKCSKCGMWNAMRADECLCGNPLTRSGERATTSPKRPVSAAQIGEAIAESLGETLRSRGLTKDGRELPAMATNPVLREELGYLMISAVYLSLHDGVLGAGSVESVFSSFLECCAGDFPQRVEDGFSVESARARAKACSELIGEAAKSGLDAEDRFALVGKKFSELHPNPKERPALLALGSLLFGTVLVNATSFVGQVLKDYEVVG